MNKGFVKAPNPNRLAHEEVKQKVAQQKKPDKVTLEMIYEQNEDIQRSLIYLIDLLQKRS